MFDPHHCYDNVWVRYDYPEDIETTHARFSFILYNFGIALDRACAEDALTQPDFKEAVAAALKKQEEVFALPYDEFKERYQFEPFAFDLHREKLISDNGKIIEGAYDCITLEITDNWYIRTYPNTSKRILTRYIDYDRHKKIVQKAQQEERYKIQSEVFRQIQHAVSEGVAKATKQNVQTLQQAEQERLSIQKQMDALKRQLEQLTATEERLKERDRIDEERRLAREAAKSQRSTAGYVYVLREVNGTHYKIGRTSNPDNRLKTFNVKLPYQVKYEVVIQTDDMHTLEAELHKRFADKRINGEWFSLSDDDLSYLRRLAD